MLRPAPQVTLVVDKPPEVAVGSDLFDLSRKIGRFQLIQNLTT